VQLRKQRPVSPQSSLPLTGSTCEQPCQIAARSRDRSPGFATAGDLMSVSIRGPLAERSPPAHHPTNNTRTAELVEKYTPSPLEFVFHTGGVEPPAYTGDIPERVSNRATTR